MTESTAPLPPSFERSAVKDWRVWLSLVAGAGVCAFATAANASASCQTSGNCSPVITAVAQLVGLCFVAFALAALWRNGSRGIKFDPATGDLIWWKDRTKNAPGNGGRIHPSHITRILTVYYDDSANQVHVFDLAGERLPYLDEEVLPWPESDWIDQLATAYPQITVETR